MKQRNQLFHQEPSICYKHQRNKICVQRSTKQVESKKLLCKLLTKHYVLLNFPVQQNFVTVLSHTCTHISRTIFILRLCRSGIPPAQLHEFSSVSLNMYVPVSAEIVYVVILPNSNEHRYIHPTQFVTSRNVDGNTKSVVSQSNYSRLGNQKHRVSCFLSGSYYEVW